MVNVQAQNERGNARKTHDHGHGHGHGMWIGGGVGFGTLSTLDYTIAPSWGMMLNDNMGIGITASYSGGDVEDISESLWSIEPYFRYYLPVSDNFKFYGDAFVSFGGGKVGDVSHNNDLGIGARAGLQYWFTSKWSIAASTNIIQYVDKDNDDSKFGVGVDFSAVNFSLFFHF